MAPFGTGGEFIGGGSSSGGGSGTIPKNLVVGGPSESVATIEIPGLSGSPDIIPASPSTFNDEFDQDAAGVPTGWTSTASLFGSLPTCNTNDILSHLHMICGAGAFINGIFKAAPTAFPFTMIVKMADCVTRDSFNAAGVYVGAQAPGVAGNLFAIQATGVGAAESPIQVVTVNSATGVPGGGTTVGIPSSQPMYFKFVVTATTITRFWSRGGLTWNGVAATTGLTIANPFCGLYVETNGATQNGEAAFDWIRFS